jgi:hypothetical protein
LFTQFNGIFIENTALAKHCSKLSCVLIAISNNSGIDLVEEVDNVDIEDDGLLMSLGSENGEVLDLVFN